MSSSTTDRRIGLTGSAAIKTPVACATTANITLSGEQTIDGVTTSSSRVLVKNQTDQSTNGVYDSSTGSWTRALDFDGPNDVVHFTIVPVGAGTTNGNTLWYVSTSDPITIGTSNIAFGSLGTVTTPVSISNGGTGTTSAANALAGFGVIAVSSVVGTNTITGSVASTVAAYSANQVYLVIPANANTGATTANFTPSGSSALGAKNVFFQGAALAGGELQANVPTLWLYDGTQFNIVANGAGVLKQNTPALADMLIAPSAGANVYSSLSAPNVPINLTLSCSVGSSALTIAVKTRAGNDPSTTAPVFVPFRNATAATGDYSWLSVTAATSLTISSGSTLGTANNVAFRVWIVGFNDGGTFRLGAINCLTTSAGAGAGRDVTAIYALAQFGIASSTAEGGAGAADSALTFYTGTAVSLKAYTVLGYITYESGLATAGTYASTPTRIQLYGLGVPLPGQIIQVQRTDTGTSATGTTTIPYDNTIPQSTEGDQYMSQTVTPGSAANVLGVSVLAMLSTTVAIGNVETLALFQDSTANALKASHQSALGNASPFSMPLNARVLASTTSATTFKARAGNQAANTTTFNGNGGSQDFNGVMNSYIEVTEMMA